MTPQQAIHAIKAIAKAKGMTPKEWLEVELEKALPENAQKPEKQKS